ncbi:MULTISPECIES: MBL fold metallo-hydrolase [Deinococcus]|uniref:MBL fold metallo-hydrolase n=1 Tax=Deinococcus rufus TaxID=2136097 RepID=A0ABV7Z764_9DEIO|nr:MBL fold metallo-hydrolase [Deinococcus sp. AB2017081]WQE97149.1 hypothetical protein U2P90_18915 [Deinococcus sp. AB2017081]
MAGPAVPSVRMYRNGLDGETLGGLGDCFLLTLPGEDEPRHILIDCGLFLHSEKIKNRLHTTLLDIYTATGGHLHAIVLTHQHYDHLSGFILGFDKFKTFKVDEVWLAWTEDPADPQAAVLRHSLAVRTTTLQESTHALAGMYQGDKDRTMALQEVQNLLGFAGDTARGVSAPSVSDIMMQVAAHVSEQGGRVRYLSPGESWVLPASPTATRVFVLGPPRDPALLRRSDPHSGANKEVYLSQLLGHALASAAGTAAPNDPPLPFDERLRIDLKAGIETHYPAYNAQDATWRTLDASWISMATDLALNLDQDTNNTSLVLAFELSPGGDVLLFPGDAQVGNWLSWFDLQFAVTDTGQPEARSVDARALLARTAIYKVGHHGSHNATLKAQGLELMIHPNLVALIPVDEVFARSRGTKGWAMPYPEMYDELRRRTSFRVLRADQPMASEPPNGATPEDVAKWKEFTKRVTETPLYFEYRLNLEESHDRPRKSSRRHRTPK